MRLIDAEALEQDFYDRYDRKGYRNGKSLIYAAWCLLKKLIDNAPTIEAKPVVHAHWFILDDCANEGVYCSACRKKIYRVNYANPKLVESKYCPNCGAQMDEEVFK